MNNLDIILVIALFIGFIMGYFKGLIKQLTFAAGIIIGLLQAVFFYPVVSQKILTATEWGSTVCNITAFISIIITIVLIFKIFGWLLSAILRALCLGFIDKILGALFSSGVAAIIIVGGVNAANKLLPDIELTNKTTQEQSVLYKHVQNEVFSVIGEVKEMKDK